MDDFLWLDQIQHGDRPLVGEKAYYLSHLAQRGYPVIPGFVVRAPALRQFLSTIQWLDPLFADLANSYLHLDVDNPRQLQLVAQRIRKEIIAAELPQEWVAELISISAHLEAPALILRPTLAVPTGFDGMKFSGMLESHVCALSHEALATALKQVWAELFRARSLFYWKRVGVQLQKINLAVLVQPLHNSLAAGLLQTGESTLVAVAGNIPSLSENQTRPQIWEIQATSGLGMALARGEVQPDYYRVQPESGSIIGQKLGVKTLAYRLANSPEAHLDENRAEFGQVLVNSPLEIYLLSEEQQKQYALEEKHLEELINLGKRLAAEVGPSFSFEWTLSAKESDSSATNLCITQFQIYEHRTWEAEKLLSKSSGENVVSKSSRTPDSFAPLLSSTKSKIFKGLAAAGGRARGIAQAIDDPSHNPENFATGRIIVLKSLRPDWLPLLKKAAGIVAELGGMTCHAAIIARELGIPAVVGVKNATGLIQTGESLLVDGDRGEVYLGGEKQLEIGENSEFIPITLRSGQRLTNFNIQNSLFPMATQLMVNLSQLSTIERAANLPVDGVGLLRSEMMLLEVLEGQHPSRWLTLGRRQELVELLSSAVCQFAGAFAPRPVFYRSLDLRSHEFQLIPGESLQEVNPMLGQRGTFSYLQDPTLFDLELEVLCAVYESGYTNVNLILPFVRTIEEFTFCRRRIEQAGLFDFSQFQVWIMAEVPSILFLLPDYVKAGCMGISIGTNDLTQLLLGVDRDQPEMATAFDERHPAVMQAIAKLIQMAKVAGIPCSICGQAPAQYPELIDRLVEWGITSISVSLDAVEHTYSAIVRAEQRLLLEAARQQLKKYEV